MNDRLEISGVGLGDLYRDQEGVLWEVTSLCNEPTATVRRVDAPMETETHVIDCLNWRSKWAYRYDERKIG